MPQQRSLDSNSRINFKEQHILIEIPPVFEKTITSEQPNNSTKEAATIKIRKTRYQNSKMVEI
jgi:hypothetical protein